jgi:acyl-[acyl-carrier-protein]-phospholipid O-acyltransferase/long-chain-fatty-acid--[acyl-carrier-protein] ligase
MIEKGGAEGLCSVTAVPDEQRGERLVAFYTNQALPPKELWERLCQSELPRLWVPKPENFCLLESLPMLGTGKVDLKRLKVMAREWTRARADADETS